MVKRVKDMTVQVTEGKAPVDTKKMLSEVAQIDSIVSIDNEDSRDYRQNTLIVPDTCPLCELGVGRREIKYYDVALLKKFMSVRGKIIPREKSGMCALHQRTIKRAISRARVLALLPYIEMNAQ